ncbi:hypothetical protein JCM1841_001309 [Sporobolomyces salmonicolor]
MTVTSRIQARPMGFLTEALVSSACTTASRALVRIGAVPRYSVEKQDYEDQPFLAVLLAVFVPDPLLALLDHPKQDFFTPDPEVPFLLLRRICAEIVAFVTPFKPKVLDLQETNVSATGTFTPSSRSTTSVTPTPVTHSTARFSETPVSSIQTTPCAGAALLGSEITENGKQELKYETFRGLLEFDVVAKSQEATPARNYLISSSTGRKNDLENDEGVAAPGVKPKVDLTMDELTGMLAALELATPGPNEPINKIQIQDQMKEEKDKTDARLAPTLTANSINQSTSPTSLVQGRSPGKSTEATAVPKVKTSRAQAPESAAIPSSAHIPIKKILKNLNKERKTEEKLEKTTTLSTSSPDFFAELGSGSSHLSSVHFGNGASNKEKTPALSTCSATCLAPEPALPTFSFGSSSTTRPAAPGHIPKSNSSIVIGGTTFELPPLPATNFPPLTFRTPANLANGLLSSSTSIGNDQKGFAFGATASSPSFNFDCRVVKPLRKCRKGGRPT